MVSTQGALSKFIKRGIQCVGCRATILEGALCKHCQSKEGTVGQCAFFCPQRSLSASSVLEMLKGFWLFSDFRGDRAVLFLQIAAAKALEMQALEKEHSALWTECQR